MAKLTQADIKLMADQYAVLDKKISKACGAMNDELAPLLEDLEKKSAPIRKKHEAKIQKLRDEQAAIETEVVGWLNRAGRPLALEGELAIAAVESKVGSRVIDPQKFFDLVKAKGSEFWACFRVEIAKAERFLGKTKVDEVSTKESKLVATIRIK